MKFAGPPAGKSRAWLIAVIAVVLAIDYATIIRIEIFSEIRNGKTALQAVTEGNLVLTLVGITISVIGVAWILYLLLGKSVTRD